MYKNKTIPLTCWRYSLTKLSFELGKKTGPYKSALSTILVFYTNGYTQCHFVGNFPESWDLEKPTSVDLVNSTAECSTVHRCYTSGSCLLWFAVNFFFNGPRIISWLSSKTKMLSVKIKKCGLINYVPKIEVWIAQCVNTSESVNSSALLY